ncbi:MAG: DNA (cytosine-5-)-methyltransferase [Beijerinckiaceae bacterium]
MTQHQRIIRPLRQIATEFTLLRQQAGLTLEDTAKLLEVSERTAYRYESGDARPSRLAVRMLLVAIGERMASGGPKASAASGFRFIDLFAGIGGLRRGFETIGGRCVFTSEWDLKCQETYRLNYPDNHAIAGDIRPYAENPALVPAHDLLLAGFPCQPFSIAGVSKKNALGRPHGFLCDTQGTLFFDTAQIIAHHRPAAFVLENVKNLQRHDQGRTFATIIHVLTKELGYNVQYRIISSEPWVPQKRERIFIVGFREPTDFDLNSLKLPETGPKLGTILEPEVDPKYTLTPRLWQYLQDYKAKHNAAGNGFGFSLFGPGDVTRTLSARYYKDGSEILVAQKGQRPRRLTPRECARLMGFDTKAQPFRIGVSDTQAYKQFGNAVVVPVVQFLAKAMEVHLNDAVGKVSESSRAPARLVTRPDRPEAVARHA